MKSISLVLLLCFGLAVRAQSNDQIVLGKADSVYSKILRENRPLWVHLPDTTSPDGVFAKQRYPVVYLMDGWEQNFSMVTSIVQLLGGGSGNLAFPSLIVVGIPGDNRNRDYTPTHITESPMMDSASLSVTGGGENFISFMEKELIPHIDSLYPTAPYRVFIGHSLGGLMSLYTLLHHRNLFNAYLAIDPTTIWDHQLVLKQAKSALEKSRFDNRSLFLPIANTIESGVDTALVGFHMRTNFQLRDLLESTKGNGLVSACKYYPDYDHQSVPLVAVYDGLRFIFNFDALNFPYGEFFKPSYSQDTLLSSHYKLVSERMGYTLAPPEQFVNGVAHELMGMNQLDRAHYFFKLNVENYPSSFTAWEAIGDFYAKKGDRQDAIQCYRKSLSLGGTTDARQKLEKLKTAH